MDTFLESQAENKSVDLFIGKDYEVFCEEIIKEYEKDKPYSYRLADYLQKSLLYSLMIVMVMGGYNFIKYGKGNFEVSILGIIFAFFISFLSIPFSRRTFYPSIPVIFSKNIVIRKGRFRTINIISWFSILIPAIISHNIKMGYGVDLSNYKINLSNNWIYIVIVLVIIVSITRYKIHLIKDRK